MIDQPQAKSSAYKIAASVNDFLLPEVASLSAHALYLLVRVGLSPSEPLSLLTLKPERDPDGLG